MERSPMTTNNGPDKETLHSSQRETVNSSKAIKPQLQTMTSTKLIGCTAVHLDISGYFRVRRSYPFSNILMLETFLSSEHLLSTQMPWGWENLLEKVLREESPWLWWLCHSCWGIWPTGSWTIGVGSDWVIRPPAPHRLAPCLFQGVFPSFCWDSL